MRLLSTQKVEVIEAYGTALPPYAILSHTWFDHEILLQDLQTPDIVNTPWESVNAAHPTFPGVKKLPSLIKLIGCTNLARQNEFSHVWVDTCCIDKTSSAELSEAINSMYQWYAGAEICFAYLSDVPSAEIEDPHEVGSKFRHSRWFKRGWTLQELIASPQVLFFTGDWEYLGAKTGDLAFAKLLNEITGIQLPVLLRELSPQDMSIATRMQWAAARQTTRVEDIAYCLLGIFDINMPLLYGEGKRSFIRLQEAILVKEEDQSLFAWHAELFSSTAIDDYWQSGNFCGLLADSPERFWNDSDIETAMPLILESNPSAVTSRGLGVDFLLLPCDKDGISYDADFRVVLNCERFRDGVRESPVIYLKRIWGLGDQFARVRADLIDFVSPGDVNLFKDGIHERIFVKQDPSTDMRTINIMAAKDTSQLNLLDDSRIATGWKVKDAWPRQGWVEKTQTFQTRELTFGLPCSVLRLEADNTDQPLSMDVAIGMHVFGRMCRSWCQIMNLNPVAKPEGTFLWATTEAKAAKVAYSGASSQDIHGADAPVWIHVTERNRKKRLDITLHILTTKAIDLQPSVDEDVGEIRENDGLIPVSTLLDSELKDIRILVRPLAPKETRETRETSGDYAWSSWRSEIFALLGPVTVIDSIEISVFPRLPFSSQIRINPPGERLYALDSLQTYCLNALPAGDQDTRRLVHQLWEGDETGRKSHLEAAEMLKKRTDSFLRLYPIHWAIISGNQEVLRQLLDNSEFDILWAGMGRLSVLHLAFLLQEPSMFECIHRWTTFVHANKKSAYDFDSFLPTIKNEDHPMHFAAAYVAASQSWDLIPELLQDFSLINAFGETPLHRAAAMGNLAAVRFLLQNNRSKVNALDNRSRTPLWHAACSDHKGEITKELLTRGALPNLTDEDGLAPIHVACKQGAYGCLKWLIAEGANLNLPLGRLGLLPAHLAVIFGQRRCLGLLIRGRAELIAHGEQNVSIFALHLAIANRQEACTRMIWTSLNPKPFFKDWSLCIQLVDSVPILKWMYVEVNEEFWHAVEDPVKDMQKLVCLNEYEVKPELWGIPQADGSSGSNKNSKDANQDVTSVESPPDLSFLSL